MDLPEKYVDTRYRPRIAIPKNDLQAMEWIKAHGDLSASVRRLIRESISKYGMVDVDCLPVRPGIHPGRPRKESFVPESGFIEPEIGTGEEAVSDGTTP